MAVLIRDHGPPRYRRTRNAFGSLLKSIVSQQISPAAAEAIHKRLVGLYAGRTPTPARVLQTGSAELRAVGLSRAKVDYVLDLAAHFDDGRLSGRKLLGWPEDKVATELVRVKGIGPWSVDIFMMFALQKPDVLPVGDLGVRKGIQAYFQLSDLPDAPTMRRLAEPWTPYRSAASWYMWRVMESAAPKKHAAARPAKRGRRAADTPRRPRRKGE